MNIYVVADNIISSLGFSSEENFEQLKNKQTGVCLLEHSALSTEPLFVSVVDTKKLTSEFDKLNVKEEYTRLEKMVIVSVTEALKQNKEIDSKSKKTLFIISSTKGNIDLLEKEEGKKWEGKRIYLWETANVIASYFNNPNTPLVVSNACISGVLGIIAGKRLLESSKWDTVIVVGVDIMTHFVVSGFQSFKAISSQVAKPYDKKRDGISLGEACGTLVLTNKETKVQGQDAKVVVMGGASSNDANHISGPSRTGDGLLLAIEKTLKESEITPSEIDYISGHGTATLFNDDMESLAIANAHLAKVPMNSLKSYFGHTLGAAGVIESIIGIHSMRKNTLIGTYNYNEAGVSAPVSIIKETTAVPVNVFLKTAAGFGGCNAAVLFRKVTTTK